ncbi:MAG: cation:proton antiporter [Acidimicrobiia bacterium]|nr:cation:proton antiporter [Acidimicrobiia bacterium]
MLLTTREREEVLEALDGIAALALLLAVAVAGGWVTGRVGLPPLLGMLLAGIAVRNWPGELLAGLPDSWSIVLRLIALTIILLRAGLGLNLTVLLELRGSLLRLSFLPNLSEAATVALVARLLLDLPLAWGLLLGFVVAAVSPAVVVPSLLDLQQRGYGVGKGIPTLVLASATFDDVVSITGFGAMLSVVFADRGEASIVESLVRAPVELAAGLVAGLVAGGMCAVAARAPSWVRFGLLLGLGLAAVFGGWAIGFAGGGSLAAMTMGAVSGRAWGGSFDAVAKGLARSWTVAQPILFGLIGAAVALSAVEPSYVRNGLLILAIGLAVRVLVTYHSTSESYFSFQERLFIALAWIPKATVQAAIGALALDLARQYESGPQDEIRGIQIVTIAVLAILVTAPIGAVAIAWTGPRWLERHVETSD